MLRFVKILLIQLRKYCQLAKNTNEKASNNCLLSSIVKYHIYSYIAFKYLQVKSMASPFGNIISVVTIATGLEPSMFAELTLGIETSVQNSFLLYKQRSIRKINNVESLRSKEIKSNYIK